MTNLYKKGYKKCQSPNNNLHKFCKPLRSLNCTVEMWTGDDTPPLPSPPRQMRLGTVPVLAKKTTMVQ